MDPFTSDRNFTPTSTELVSGSAATAGVAVLGQIVHPDVQGLCACTPGTAARNANAIESATAIATFRVWPSVVRLRLRFMWGHSPSGSRTHASPTGAFDTGWNTGAGFVPNSLTLE